MELTKIDVAKLASLARLKLTDEETARYAATLGAILAHVDRLQGYMSGKDVVVDRRIVTDPAELRSDEPRVGSTRGESVPTPREYPTRDELLASARAMKDGRVIVPGVFKQGKS